MNGNTQTHRLNGAARLFDSAPRNVLRAFVTAALPVKLRAREVLFHAGDAGASCYYLRSGAAKASVVARDGQERLLAILGPGALIGELSLFDDQPRSATVSALRPCQLMQLTKSAFFRLADSNPQVYRQALRLLTARLRGTNDSVVAQGTVTVLGRVARAFTSLADGLGEEQDGGRILLAQRITQTDIAAMAGVARENANRAISELMHDGVLSRDRGYYAIEKPEALADLSEI
jgi:CRP/FNR family transcriptional regulator, cyclic AMP receptor protein